MLYSHLGLGEGSCEVGGCSVRRGLMQPVRALAPKGVTQMLHPTLHPPLFLSPNPTHLPAHTRPPIPPSQHPSHPHTPFPPSASPVVSLGLRDPILQRGRSESSLHETWPALHSYTQRHRRGALMIINNYDGKLTLSQKSIHLLLWGGGVGWMGMMGGWSKREDASAWSSRTRWRRSSIWKLPNDHPFLDTVYYITRTYTFKVLKMCHW